MGVGRPRRSRNSADTKKANEKPITGTIQAQYYQPLSPLLTQRIGHSLDLVCARGVQEETTQYDMGLAPGGRMRQEIYEDDQGFDKWHRESRSRCFIHLSNSLVWRTITGEDPPTVPFSAKEYTEAELPWFEFYSDKPALEGSEQLARLKSVAKKAKQKGDVPLPDNATITPEHVVKLRDGLRTGQVREGEF